MPFQLHCGGKVGDHIPKIFHFVVPTGTSSAAECIGTVSAKEIHPDWGVRVWNDTTELRNARLNGYLSKCRSVTQRANLIGLEAILREGGVYIDSSMRVLRQLDPLVESVSFFIASEDGSSPSDGVYGAAPNHPAIESLIHFLEENEPDWAMSSHVSTGAGLFAKVLAWRTDICIYPRETFFPCRGDGSIPKFRSLSYCERAPVAGKDQKVDRAQIAPTELQTRKVAARLARGALQPFVSAVRRVVGQPNIPRSFPSYPVSEKIVVCTMHGHQLVANGSDYSLTPRLVRDGCIEFASERFLSKVIKGGDWFIDVGANIGVFSLIAAGKCGPFGRVFAFEPNPWMAQLLMEGAALNFFHDRLSVKKIAIANSNKKRRLHILRNRPGDARLVEPGSEQVSVSNGTFARTRQYLPDSEIVEVESNKLDDLFPTDVPIKAIKIDVEGYEGDVLAGAERLLKVRAFQYVIIEAIVEAEAGRWKNTLVWFTKLLEFGYDVCTPNGEGNLVRHASISLALEQMSEHNLVFAAREGPGRNSPAGECVPC